MSNLKDEIETLINRYNFENSKTIESLKAKLDKRNNTIAIYNDEIYRLKQDNQKLSADLDFEKRMRAGEQAQIKDLEQQIEWLKKKAK